MVDRTAPFVLGEIVRARTASGYVEGVVVRQTIGKRMIAGSMHRYWMVVVEDAHGRLRGCRADAVERIETAEGRWWLERLMSKLLGGLTRAAEGADRVGRHRHGGR